MIRPEVAMLVVPNDLWEEVTWNVIAVVALVAVLPVQVKWGGLRLSLHVAYHPEHL
jgi:hypothetical protein